MSSLAIYPQDDGANPLERTRDGGRIAQALAAEGVRFERWRADSELADAADQGAVLEAYRVSVDRLVREGGFQSVDVIRMKPDHPEKRALREKFLQEHRHSEDEVRFFVEGKGLFFLRLGDRVFQVLCEKGDLISVPANTPHWFDMGDCPEFTAIRFFNNPDGWVAHFTGDAIANRFPKLETGDDQGDSY